MDARAECVSCLVRQAAEADHQQLADVVPIGLVEELEETVAALSDSGAVRALLDERA